MIERIDVNHTWVTDDGPSCAVATYSLRKTGDKAEKQYSKDMRKKIILT